MIVLLGGGVFPFTFDMSVDFGALPSLQTTRCHDTRYDFFGLRHSDADLEVGVCQGCYAALLPKVLESDIAVNFAAAMKKGHGKNSKQAMPRSLLAWVQFSAVCKPSFWRQNEVARWSHLFGLVLRAKMPTQRMCLAKFPNRHRPVA